MVLHDLLFDLSFNLLALDDEAEPVVEAHVLVCHPHEREAADEVTAPVFVEQVVLRDEEEDESHVVAEAVFACEQVEELSLVPAPAIPALADAEIARLAKYLFVRHSPRDAGDGKPEDEQRDYLRGQIHVNVFRLGKSITSAELSCNAITVLSRIRQKTMH